MTQWNSDPQQVLDKGYVKLIQSMGDSLTVVNAARASFAKFSLEWTEADARLVKFLLRENHTSPMRHEMMTFEVKAPLMVARQWNKYVVGSDHTMDAWNEASRRYITMEPEFYIPNADQWRSAPENKKQGSGLCLDEKIGKEYSLCLAMTIEESLLDYNDALTEGIAPEQARLFLPMYAMYTNWWWTCSLQSCLLFLDERLEHDAQWEIQQYAIAVYRFAEVLFHEIFEAKKELKND